MNLDIKLFYDPYVILEYAYSNFCIEKTFNFSIVKFSFYDF